MEDNTQKTVVSINSHRANAQSRIEVEGTQRCIGMLSWDVQVQQALALCGLHISDALLGDNVAPSANSHAKLLGHETIESLVSKPNSEDGLNLNWVDFRAQMSALVYRQKLAIEESNYQEINLLVKDATETLGHSPVNAAEYHRAKETVLKSNIASIQKESKTRIDDLQDRNKDLMRELNAEKAAATQMRTDRQALMEETASRIQQMTRELAIKQDGYQREAEHTIAQELKKAEATFNQALAAAKVDMAQQISEVQADMAEAETALAQVTSRIEAGELVEASRLVELNTRVEQAKEAEAALRRQMIGINDLLTQANKRADILEDEKAMLETTIKSMAEQMAMLELRMREQVEDKMSSSEFAVLHERLQVRKEEFEAQGRILAETNTKLENATLKLGEANVSISQLRGRFAQVKQLGSEHFKRMADQLQKVNDQHAELTGKFVSMSSTNQQLRIVSIGLGVVTIAACAVIGVLIHNM